MGRKVHPIGFRLGVHQPWEGRWFAEGMEYQDQLHQDLQIRKLIRKEADKAGVSHIEVERFPGKVKIVVHTAKPGILIGRKGDTVKKIRQELEALTGRKIDLEIKEIKAPDCDALLVAMNIAGQIERRVSYRRAMKRALQQAMRTCPRTQTFLERRDADGRLPWHPYQKWQGGHWVLALLAELGYPAGSPELLPLREQELDWLLGEQHQKYIRAIEGRMRRCASQEAYALWALLTFGLADERCDELAARLIKWQWQDGGWNCDRRPEVVQSSYHESWLPMRALHLYAKLKGNDSAQAAVERSAELFLKRRLFHRLRDGNIMSPDFMHLRYPRYWRYDVLGALKMMAECEYLSDPRCKDGLDWLESRRLVDGGFSADDRVYTVTIRDVSGRSAVAWGSVGKAMNPWVTLEALGVLKAAGRWSPDQA